MKTGEKTNELAHKQSTNDGLRELSLFTGAGGGILGGHLLGWKTVCAVEWTAYAAGVLIARQNDGILPPFPIWDDVQTFDGKPWRGFVDVVSGGFPCQDISAAGKGAGINGPRSGMWSHMARIICEVEPRYVFVENSPMLTSRGLGRVLGDLAAMGYDAKWGVLGADDVGAPHRRKRIWIVAYAKGRESGKPSERERGQGAIGRGCDFYGDKESRPANMADSDSVRESQPKRGEFNQRGWSCNSGEDVAHAGHLRGRNGAESDKPKSAETSGCSEVGISYGTGLQGDDDHPESPRRLQRQLTQPSWWKFEPDVGRVADGVAARMDRLKAIGNGQVSLVAKRAWRILIK